MAVTQLTNRQVLDGTLVIADFSATGTPSASTYLRGDNTWSSVSGGGTSGQTTVNFGANTTQENNAVVTVSAAGVLTGSIIRVSPFAGTTATHDPEDYALEQITAYATNIINGVSFDIIANSENGTFGSYLINYAF